MPDPVWWVINRVAVEQSPARVVGKLVERGVRTLLVCGELEDWMLWRGERRARRQLERTGLMHLVVVPHMDHGMLQNAVHTNRDEAHYRRCARPHRTARAEAAAVTSAGYMRQFFAFSS